MNRLRGERAAKRRSRGPQSWSVASVGAAVAIVSCMAEMQACSATPTYYWRLDQASAGQYLMSNFFPMPRGAMTIAFWVRFSTVAERAMLWYGGEDGMTFTDNQMLLWTRSSGGERVTPWFTTPSYSGMTSNVRARVSPFTARFTPRTLVCRRTVALTLLACAANMRAGMAPFWHHHRRN